MDNRKYGSFEQWNRGGYLIKSGEKAKFYINGVGMFIESQVIKKKVRKHYSRPVYNPEGHYSRHYTEQDERDCEDGIYDQEY